MLATHVRMSKVRNRFNRCIVTPKSYTIDTRVAIATNYGEFVRVHGSA